MTVFNAPTDELDIGCRKSGKLPGFGRPALHGPHYAKEVVAKFDAGAIHALLTRARKQAVLPSFATTSKAVLGDWML